MTDDRLSSLLQDGLPEQAAVPPELLYWRAELQERRDREEKAARPILALPWIALPLLAAIGLVVAPVWWVGLVPAVLAIGSGVALHKVHHSE